MRRLVALELIPVVVLAGLWVHGVDGVWADPAGDAAYAALIYLLAVVAIPRWRPGIGAGVATVACWAVELFQLTGIPAELASHWPVALVLGAGFDPADLVWYLAGAVAAACLDWAVWYPVGSHS